MTMQTENTGTPAAEPEVSELEMDVASVFALEQPSAEETGAPAAAEATSQPAALEGAGTGEAQSPAPVSPAAPAATPAAPEPAPAVEPGQQPTPPAPTTPAAAPTPVDEAALRTASLEAQVAALTQALNESRAQPQGQPAPESGQGPAAAQLPQYALTVPQQVEDAILSEDPQVFRAGMLNLINSLATIIHHNVRTEFNGRLQQFQSSLRDEGTAATREQELVAAKEQYYSLFPQHKDPVLLPIIQQQSGKLAAEYPGLSWGPEFMNALGARVNAAVDQLRGGGQQTPFTPAPTGQQPPARPAAGLPSGTRGQVPGSELDGVDLIEDTFR